MHTFSIRRQKNTETTLEQNVTSIIDMFQKRNIIFALLRKYADAFALGTMTDLL